MPNTFREPERVEPISGSEPKQSVRLEGEDESLELSKTKFDEAVRKADPSRVEMRTSIQEVAPAQSGQSVQKPSLIALASEASSGGTPKVAPTPKDLESQASGLRQAMERPRAMLIDTSQTVALPSGDVAKLSGHLEHIDRGLRDISRMTTGVEVGSSIAARGQGPSQAPAVRFLRFLTESDKRLGGFVDEVKGLHMDKQRLSPEVLFAVQIKMNFIQQELEFFTTTLSKALESTKTIMNVQI